MNLIRAKHRAWRYYRQCKSCSSLSIFRSFAQITRKKIRSFYRKREHDTLQSRNTRLFYSYINHRLFPPPVTLHLKDPNNLATLLVDHSQVTNIFSKYFGSVFSQNDLSQSPPINLLQHNQMSNIIFDPSKIKHVLKSY